MLWMRKNHNARLERAMVYKVIFTESSEKDRDGIALYFSGTDSSTKGLEYFFDELDALVARLSNEPFMYEKVHEKRLAERGYRRAFFGNYVAVYCIYDNIVEISRIFHQKQDYAKLL